MLCRQGRTAARVSSAAAPGANLPGVGGRRRRHWDNKIYIARWEEGQIDMALPHIDRKAWVTLGRTWK